MITGDEPAMPVLTYEQNQGGVFHYQTSGTTIRQYFTAMALTNFTQHTYSGVSPEEIAEYAVKIADATIKELNKKQ